MVGIQHLRINLFLLRLQYLKALIKIFGLINRFKIKFPY